MAKMHISMWAPSHHGVNTDFGYIPQFECRTDSVTCGTRVDDYWGASHIANTAQKVWIIVDPNSPESRVKDWEGSVGKDNVVGYFVYDEPDLAGVSPADVAKMIAKIKAVTDKPIWLNTFLSRSIYSAQNLEKIFDNMLDGKKQADIVAKDQFHFRPPISRAATGYYDALEYANCGMHLWTFDHYSAHGTENCSWLATQSTLPRQLAAFREKAPSTMKLGLIAQSYNFGRCGVSDVDRHFMKWHYDQCLLQWGPQAYLYAHYAHVPSNSEGQFPPNAPLLRGEMRAFRDLIESEPPPPPPQEEKTTAVFSIHVGSKTWKAEVELA